MNLTELAININEAFSQSKEFYQAGIEALTSAIASDKKAGEILLKVKSFLPYGEFGGWVTANCHFTHRHANRLMVIAKNWEKITATLDTRVEAESPLLSLRSALSLATAEPKPEAPPPEPTPKYKVALKNHPCYGETVEVKQELNHGDILLCKTSNGDFAFVKKELVPESQSLEPINAEIIDEEKEDISEQLKQAIALVIEYLSEMQLKAVLAASLSIGKDHLPTDALFVAAKLIGGQEIAVLNQGDARGLANAAL
ncbi:DUF3102 domain-containing protein [Nostoc sp. JL23]|uniref:DUF3102 domain-containing protein n=1 Tax=Nostoc sp. JL23 TaxID=2815394 RepID=UPI001D6F23A8|nr:DUF3102 domain-containing protein [Nostoc sp. JL23]MBN3875224.1 DUF3102 domain-containing protein [Nostoc sp. JL23]